MLEKYYAIINTKYRKYNIYSNIYDIASYIRYKTNNNIGFSYEKYMQEKEFIEYIVKYKKHYTKLYGVDIKIYQDTTSITYKIHTMRDLIKIQQMIYGEEYQCYWDKTGNKFKIRIKNEEFKDIKEEEFEKYIQDNFPEREIINIYFDTTLWVML